MDDKRSRVLQIARQLEMGIYSQNQIAKTLHVSKNLVSTIMEVMRENKWNYNDLVKMDTETIQQVFRRRDYTGAVQTRETMYKMPAQTGASEKAAKGWSDHRHHSGRDPVLPALSDHCPAESGQKYLSGLCALANSTHCLCLVGLEEAHTPPPLFFYLKRGLSTAC